MNSTNDSYQETARDSLKFLKTTRERQDRMERNIVVLAVKYGIEADEIAEITGLPFSDVCSLIASK